MSKRDGGVVGVDYCLLLLGGRPFSTLVDGCLIGLLD